MQAEIMNDNITFSTIAGKYLDGKHKSLPEIKDDPVVKGHHCRCFPLSLTKFLEQAFIGRLRVTISQCMEINGDIRIMGLEAAVQRCS